MIWYFFIPLISGLMVGLATAPVSLWFLAWVGLVPFWLLIAKNYHCWQQVLLIASAWGLGYYGLALFWITGVHPMTWMGVPWLASLLIALVCWLLITSWGIALVAVWGLGLAWAYRQHKGTIFVLVAGITLWCVLESLWSSSPLWWSSLAYTQSPHNLIILQLGKLSGISVLTSLLVGANGLLAQALISQKKVYAGVALLILVLAHGLGLGLFFQSRALENNQKLEVGIIQGNVPNTIKLYPEGWRRALEGYTQGYTTLAAQGVDVVLTPETALPFHWSEIKNNSSFYQAILRERVPVWLGAFGSLGSSYTNSLFMVTQSGEVTSRFDKVKLVPLGEYIPLAGILGGLINRLSPLDAHLAPGKPEQVFVTPFGRVAVGICYESAFGEHFRRQVAQGAEFIITASNNAHYSASMPAQHHALDVMRAIESDRMMVRATNTGYSALVSQRGETLWISGLNTYEIHRGTVERRSHLTPYVRWGDWWTKVLVILFLLLASSHFLPP